MSSSLKIKKKMKNKKNNKLKNFFRKMDESSVGKIRPQN